MARPSDHRTALPLLHDNSSDDDLPHSRGRPSHIRPRSPLPPSSVSPKPATHFSRRSTLRSRFPTTNTARLAARKKYTYAAIFLVVSLVAFTIQTELAAYIQGELGWNKAYCMLYFTHGSWALLWPVQLVVLRLQKRDMPWSTFWRRHVWLLRSTASMVEQQTLEVRGGKGGRSPWAYMVRTTAGVTMALTVAGLSWYVAVSMTTPSDLTAIYNCSAFFAYVFSVPLLNERLRLDKSVAVAVAIAGVLVVAYGDEEESDPGEVDSSRRFLGNLIIGVGSVLYGLYEVLYKRYACPPEGCSAGRGMIFANAFGSLIGAFTLSVLWVPLPILHILGWETFELPTGYTAWLLLLSVVMNATFAGSFLVLISLTSPVLSSVAALLTIFIVAVVDWMWTGKPLSRAAVFGGSLIIVAFCMLSWSTWREMAEDERRKEVDISPEESDKDDE
jgi:drug/metabolite transporter (DMT)-like permease